MKHLLVAIALSFAAVSPAFAHPDHDMIEMESPREVALTSAVDVKARLIERGAIPASWRDVAASNATLRQRNGADEWVVTFRNDAVTNPAERVLYVVLSYTGVYIAANFTGQ